MTATYLREALDLARLGRGQTSPNPMVGAVLVRDGQIVGRGFHTYAGVKHAEVLALKQAGEQARGAELYKLSCQKCHLPPVADLLADLQSAKPEFWWKNNQGKSFVAVRDIKQTYVGTDPHEAFDFNGRTAETSDLGKGPVSAGAGLDLVTKAIALKFFDENKLTPEQRIAWSGFRDPRDPAVRSEPIYKARPLNGIWAVAPYLHNGSIPNLYALLSPQEERPDTFWTGSNQFDPVKVGFDTSPLKGGYLFDTRRAGNSNNGHEFKNGPKGNGVIGPALTPDDRNAIIEYLKSL